MTNSPKNKSSVQLPEAPEFKFNLKSFHFWRDCFLVFWFYSFVGHLIEYVWFAILRGIVGPSIGHNIPFFVIAVPYGLGALAIIWFVYPLVQKRKINFLGSFVLSTIAATIAEFICALVITLSLGHNPYWDYSNEPFNLFGFVCLRNSLLFGLASVILIYIAFPATVRLMRKIGNKWLNIAFWVLFILYVTVQIGRLFYGDATIA